MKKKLFSWILCLAMVLQLAPMTGFAEGEESESLECQPISSAQDLAEGDTVVLLAQSQGDGQWYAFANETALPVTYADGMLTLPSQDTSDESIEDMGTGEVAMLNVASVESSEQTVSVTFSCDYVQWDAFFTGYLSLMDCRLMLSSEMNVPVPLREDADGVTLLFPTYAYDENGEWTEFQQPVVLVREYENYYFGVKSPWANEEDDWTYPVAYLFKLLNVPQADPPAAPTSLQAEPDDELSVHLTWEPSEGAMVYNIYRDGEQYQTSSQPEFYDWWCERDVTYTYQVSARNRGGESPLSDPVQATARLGLPSAPQNLAAQPGLRGTRVITLTWDSPERWSRMNGYKVYRDGELLTSLITSNRTYQDEVPDFSTSYHYSVCCYNEVGEGEAAELDVVSPPLLPDAWDVQIRLTLPMAGQARYGLSKGVIQLIGERSYSMPISQNGDVGVYDFENVLEDTYTVRVVLGSNKLVTRTNALTVVKDGENALDITAGGLVRFRQPAGEQVYLPDEGTGWSTDDEGYLTDSHGDSAFYRTALMPLKAVTPYYYDEEADAYYQPEQSVTADPADAVDGVVELPQGTEAHPLAVTVAYSAGGVSLKGMTVTARILQNDRFVASSSLRLDASGRATLLLPEGSGYAVGLSNSAATLGDTDVSAKTVDPVPVSGGDTLYVTLNAKGWRTLTLDFSDTLSGLSGLSLAGVQYKVTDSGYNTNITGELDASGRASVRVYASSDEVFTVCTYACYLSDEVRLGTFWQQFSGSALSGSIPVTVYERKSYSPIFYNPDGISLDGVIVTIKDHVSRWDVTLEDKDGDGWADPVSFTAVNPRYTVEKQRIGSNCRTNDSCGDLTPGTSQQSIPVSKSVHLRLPEAGDGWSYAVLLWRASTYYDGVQAQYFSTDTSDFTIWIPRPSGIPWENERVTVAVLPYRSSFKLLSYDLRDWQAAGAGAIQSAVPAPDYPDLDFTGILTEGGFSVVDAGGTDVSDITYIGYYAAGKLLGDQDCSSAADAGWTPTISGLSSVILPQWVIRRLDGARYYVDRDTLRAPVQPGTVTLPYQMQYRVEFLNEADAPVLPAKLNLAVFDTHRVRMDIDWDGRWITLKDPSLTTDTQLKIMAANGYISEGMTESDSLYTFLDTHPDAAQQTVNLYGSNGKITFRLPRMVYRVNARITSVTLESDGRWLVRGQLPVLSGVTVRLAVPEGAADLRLNSQTYRDNGSGMIEIDLDSVSAQHFSFTLDSATLESGAEIGLYLVNDGEAQLHRMIPIPYQVFSGSMRREYSSNELLFDEIGTASFDDETPAYSIHLADINTVGGQYWDLDSPIVMGGVGKTEYDMDSYRAEQKGHHEGAWFYYETVLEDFDIALFVNGVPVEYSDDLTTLILRLQWLNARRGASSVGSGGGGASSGGSIGFADVGSVVPGFSATAESAPAASLGAWDEENGIYWMSAAGLTKDGLFSPQMDCGFLYVPLSEPESFPGANRVEVRFRYRDGAGETQELTQTEAVFVYQNAPILLDYAVSMTDFEELPNSSSSVSAMEFFENIRSKEDRERYEASMHQGSDLMANSSPVYSVKARFDLPDEVTDVMLVADLPDTCETRYITLHREDDGNYNYVGTGVLGDAVDTPTHFGLVYSLVAAQPYEDLPALEISDWNAYRASYEPASSQLPEGWRVEELAPENGWTLPQTYAAWDAYLADADDGMLDDLAPYTDENGRLYWPAAGIYDDTDRLMFVNNQYLNFGERIEPESSYTLALTDKGALVSRCTVGYTQDDGSGVVTQVYEADDPQILLPDRTGMGTELSPTARRSRTVLASLAPQAVRIPLNVDKVVQAVSTTNDIVGELNNYRTLVNTAVYAYDGIPDWAQYLPEDALAEYLAFRAKNDIGTIAETAFVAADWTGISTIPFLIFDKFVGNKIDQIEETYKKIAEMNKKHIQRMLWLAQYTGDPSYISEISCSIRLIDPSGYVYEGTEDNRVEGVTATIYRYTGKTNSLDFGPDGTLWYGSVNNSLWVPWNSEDYGEGPNPKVTDGAGRYGWNVLPGVWKVVFEKEGYHQASSRVLGVPPEHLDVNICMSALNGAQLVEFAPDTQGITLVFDKPVVAEDVERLVHVTLDGETLSERFAPVDGQMIQISSKQGGNQEYVLNYTDVARTFRLERELPLGETVRLLPAESVRSYNRLVADIPGADGQVEEYADPITALSYEGSTDDLEAGDSRNLRTGLSITGTEGTLEWSCLTPELATVSASGRITALESDEGGWAIVRVRVKESDVSTLILLYVAPVDAAVKPLPVVGGAASILSADAQNADGQIRVTATFRNKTSETLTGKAVAALYQNGRLLYPVCMQSITVAAEDSVEQTLTLRPDLLPDSMDGVTVRIFFLAPGSMTPLAEAVTVSVTE